MGDDFLTKGRKITHTILIISILIISFALTGCKSKENTENKESETVVKRAAFTNIKPDEAKKRLDAGENIILLDVRTEEEYKEGYIDGAMLIPLDKLQSEAEFKLLDKNAPIFIYCRSGRRSITAVGILASQGYNNLYNLGGILDWPYEVVK
jgi:phage shock protein E